MSFRCHLSKQWVRSCKTFTSFKMPILVMCLRTNLTENTSLFFKIMHEKYVLLIYHSGCYVFSVEIQLVTIHIKQKNMNLRLCHQISAACMINTTWAQHEHWLSAVQVTSHYLKQWWLVYWRVYASLGLNELNTYLHKLWTGQIDPVILQGFLLWCTVQLYLG